MSRYHRLVSVPLVIAVAIALAACVDAPGAFIDVQLPRVPSPDDCATLARAIVAKRPELAITRDGHPDGWCAVQILGRHIGAIIVVTHGNQLALQVHGKGEDQLGDQIEEIAKEVFPYAEVRRLHPKQGFGP